MYLHVPERVSTLSFVILSIGKLSRVESLSRTGHHYKHPSIRSFVAPVGGVRLGVWGVVLVVCVCVGGVVLCRCVCVSVTC